MKRLNFPKLNLQDHLSVRNVNDILEEQASVGERASDWIAKVVGSWHFIISQSIFLVIWVILNITAWVNHWDPYPFILMNLFLSMEAAFTAPIIMMSQNRQASRDRLEAHYDFLVNQKAEEEIRTILEQLNAQNEALSEIHRVLNQLQENGSDTP
ncbi:MAG: DUF1003 domain-containing protein [Candidatus Promineifilaceae bacterium]|jgi:uncharacterized membrane protein